MKRNQKHMRRMETATVCLKDKLKKAKAQTICGSNLRAAEEDLRNHRQSYHEWEP
jgi:hypothetical protein